MTLFCQNYFYFHFFNLFSFFILFYIFFLKKETKTVSSFLFEKKQNVLTCYFYFYVTFKKVTKTIITFQKVIKNRVPKILVSHSSKLVFLSRVFCFLIFIFNVRFQYIFRSRSTLNKTDFAHKKGVFFGFFCLIFLPILDQF